MNWIREIGGYIYRFFRHYFRLTADSDMATRDSDHANERPSSTFDNVDDTRGSNKPHTRESAVKHEKGYNLH